MANWNGYIFPFLYQDCGDGVTTWCKASMCFASHEYELLKLSYWDQSMSLVRSDSCVVLCQQFALNDNSSHTHKPHRNVS